MTVGNSNLDLASSKWFSGEIFDGTYFTSCASIPWSLRLNNLPMSMISLHINPKWALSSTGIPRMTCSTSLSSKLDCLSSLHLKSTKDKTWFRWGQRIVFVEHKTRMCFSLSGKRWDKEESEKSYAETNQEIIFTQSFSYMILLQKKSF